MKDVDKSKVYQARVCAIEDVFANTRIVRLELENKARLNYQAGQYVRLSFAGEDPRAYSIAAAPGGNELEFHIRDTGGTASHHATHVLKCGDPVLLQGPFGDHVWRKMDRPVLLLAGGVGIAPAKALIEAALAQGLDYPLHLFWGVRTQAALYLEDYFRTLAARAPGFHFIPVLSDQSHKDYRSGTVMAAVAETFTDLSAMAVYLSGPPAMIDAAKPVLIDLGVAPEFLFCDAF